MRRAMFGSLALLAVTLASVPAAHAQDRYSLVHGCYTLRPTAGGAASGPYRLQATDLGRYLLYTKDRRFLAAASDGSVAPASAPSPAADFRVDEAGGDTFRLSLPDKGGVALTVNGASLRTAPGQGSTFAFDKADGCPEYPEIEVNATGTPMKGALPYGETRGLIDAHMHLMAFEFLGGNAHCGRPWSPYGAPYALGNCEDAAATGSNLVLDNALAKDGPGSYTDPQGYPTFRQWPSHGLLAHEQSYYKWLERAWMGGQRMYVNLLVDNEALCKLYPSKRNPCNDMHSVRLEAADTYKLQDYIDAQNGGPGKGWFRVVTSPWQARQVVNDGKLAVVLGIEVSRLFECGVNNDVPDCDTQKIDRELGEVYDLGVRDMELVNKFDNAFGGVAADEGSTGQITGVGNKSETGKFYQLEKCKTAAQDRAPTTLPGIARDQLVGNALAAFIPNGTLPNYPADSACNSRALTTLGEYLIQRMIARHMIVDPDHLDVISRSAVLSMLEAARYSGVVSSHSWSDIQSLPRIFNLGGVVTPYAGDSKTFVEAWKQQRQMRSAGPFYFGWGYGADANGFGAQGGPRMGPNPIAYPFRSAVDPGITLDRQRSGERVFDLNKEGVAHYGLYPDWIEDLKMQAGQPIIDDMVRGPEAYLQMWERADGVPLQQCRTAHLRITENGTGFVDLGATPKALLYKAGQVLDRSTRTWKYCVNGHRNVGKKVVATFGADQRVAFVGSNAPQHAALGIHPGDRASRVSAKTTKAFGSQIRVRPIGKAGARLVYVMRNGKVHSVGVADRTAARTAASLVETLKRAGLR